MLAGANGLPDPRNAPDVRAPAPRARSTSRSARAATSTTSTSNGGTIRRIRYSAGNQPPTAVATADADERRRAADRRLRRHAARPTRTATRSPTPGTSTATAQYDDSTAATPTFTYTTRRHRHRRPAGHRPGGSERHRRADRSRPATPPTATIDHAGGGHDLEGRRHDHLLGLGDRPAAARCRRPRSAGGSTSSTAPHEPSAATRTCCRT